MRGEEKKRKKKSVFFSSSSSLSLNKAFLPPENISPPKKKKQRCDLPDYIGLIGLSKSYSAPPRALELNINPVRVLLF